ASVRVCDASHEIDHATGGVNARFDRRARPGGNASWGKEAARLRCGWVFNFLGGGGMRARQAVVWVAGILSLGACAEPLTSPKPRQGVLDAAMAPTASVATTTNLVVRLSSPAVQVNNLVGVGGDAAQGYASGSFASNGVA